MKVKATLLCLIRSPRHKNLWGSGGVNLRVFISDLDAREWSVSHPGCFIPMERAPGTHCVGALDSLDAVASRKELESNSKFHSFLLQRISSMR